MRMSRIWQTNHRERIGELMPIRRATLDDTIAIGALFRSTIDRWQRLDTAGQVQDLPYEALSVYERWLHGGAWMSVETGAIWLSHVLSGAGVALVLDNGQGIAGYAEAYRSDEPAPYHSHLHIAHRVVAAEAPPDAHDQLMQRLMNEAQTAGRLTASCSPYDTESMEFYKQYGFSVIEQVRKITLPATHSTVGFYRVLEHHNTDAAQIGGWHMMIGRTASARQHWEEVWSHLWQAVPEIVAQRVHRERFSVSGQDAFVCLQQHLYNPRSAEVYCWSLKPPTAQLIAAIREWAYEQGYRALSMAMGDALIKMIKSDVEETPYRQNILAREV